MTVAALVVVALCAAAPPEAPPRLRLTYTHKLAGRVNPLGTSHGLDAAMRLRLYDDDVPLLFSNSYLAIGARSRVTPSYARGGLFVTVAPLAVVNVTARVARIRYFGSFNTVLSFPGAKSADTSAAGLQSAVAAGRRYATDATMFEVEAKAQVAWRWLAAQNSARLSWTDIDLRAGDTVFYDPRRDLLVRDRGWTVQDDLDLVVRSDFGLLFGVRYTLEASLSRYEVLQLNQRIGPAFQYVLPSPTAGLVRSPRLGALVQWHLTHPTRTGRDVPQWVPWVGVELAYDGDLFAR